MNLSSLKQQAREEFIRKEVCFCSTCMIFNEAVLTKKIDSFIDLTYKQALSDVEEKLPEKWLIRAEDHDLKGTYFVQAQARNSVIDETKQAISLLAENNS